MKCMNGVALTRYNNTPLYFRTVRGRDEIRREHRRRGLVVQKGKGERASPAHPEGHCPYSDGGATLRCSACRERLPRSSFSKNQWRRWHDPSTTQRLRMAFAQAAKSEAELMEALVQGGCSSRCCECIGKKAKPHRMWS